LAFSDSEGNNVNLAGAISMAVLLIINVYLSGFSHMTVTTRIVFAMTRDGAFPCSKYIYGVDKRKIPLKSIIFVFFVDSLICLLPVMSDTAFSAITQISTIGY
jgi:amino acid transporter